MESEAHARFLRSLANPDAMETLDELRRTDFARLDKLGQVYLDYTGGGLYGESQLIRHYAWLSSAVLGNPHSENPASAESTQSVENARAAVLSFFGASPSEYQVVFTANASSALKLVGEAYPFTSGSRYLMTYDNHNSVNGIREYARRGGSIVQYVPVHNPDLRVDVETLSRALEQPTTGEPRLFAYPAQSNFSGVQHPLDWVREASDRGWDVILDCAAFVPTNRLDLGSVRPDFAVVSFYKMFGYPTGVGALIARRTALEKLRRPWFAGGTIIVASVQDESWYSLAPAPAGFEDGTVNYLSLSAVEMGLEYLERIGMEAIHERVMALTGWLMDQMSDLRHGNGTPVIQVFGPTTTLDRGATVAFHVLDPSGDVFDVFRVACLAAQDGISVRTGCFCNPGDGEVAHAIAKEDMAGCFPAASGPATLAECFRIIADKTGKVPNTLRASLGLPTNFGDVYRLMRFLTRFVDRSVRDFTESQFEV